FRYFASRSKVEGLLQPRRTTRNMELNSLACATHLVDTISDLSEPNRRQVERGLFFQSALDTPECIGPFSRDGLVTIGRQIGSREAALCLKHVPQIIEPNAYIGVVRDSRRHRARNTQKIKLGRLRRTCLSCCCTMTNTHCSDQQQAHRPFAEM